MNGAGEEVRRPRPNATLTLNLAVRILGVSRHIWKEDREKKRPYRQLRRTRVIYVVLFNGELLSLLS